MLGPLYTSLSVVSVVSELPKLYEVSVLSVFCSVSSLYSLGTPHIHIFRPYLVKASMVRENLHGWLRVGVVRRFEA